MRRMLTLVTALLTLPAALQAQTPPLPKSTNAVPPPPPAVAWPESSFPNALLRMFGVEILPAPEEEDATAGGSQPPPLPPAMALDVPLPPPTKSKHHAARASQRAAPATPWEPENPYVTALKELAAQLTPHLEALQGFAPGQANVWQQPAAHKPEHSRKTSGRLKQPPPTLALDRAQPPPIVLQVDTAELRKLTYLAPSTALARFGHLEEVPVGRPHKDHPQPARRIAELECKFQGDAGDAERYLELAGLYEELRAPQELSDYLYAYAGALLRDRLRAEPKNGWLHAQYAVTLWPSMDAAEKTARLAVRFAPGDWRCWDRLAGVEYTQAVAALFGGEEYVPWGEGKTGKDILAMLNEAPPSAERMARAEAYLQKALRHCNRAVAQAPEGARLDALLQRQSMDVVAIEWCRNFSRWADKPRSAFCEQLLQSRQPRDSRELLRNQPGDPELLSNLAGSYFIDGALGLPPELKASLGDLPGMNQIRQTWKAMQDKNRNEIVKIRNKLEKLTHHADPAVAESAERNLGLWLLLEGDSQGAASHCRVALAMKPTTEENWQLYLVCLQDRDIRAALGISHALVERFATPNNYLGLASLYWRMARMDDVESVLRSAVDKFPDDASCRLGLVAVLLRRDELPATLAEVDRHLQVAYRRLETEPPGSLKVNFAFHFAIYSATVGNLADARSTLKYIQQNITWDRSALKALQLFHEETTPAH